MSVRDGEAAVRNRIQQERNALKFVTEPTAFRAEMEDADKALRERVLQSGYTEDEKKQVAKIKTQEAMQAFVAARNKRLVDLYRVEVVKFREQIPELRAAWDARYEEYVNFRQAINHFNEVDERSRSITETVLRSMALLDPIEAACLNVRADVARRGRRERPRTIRRARRHHRPALRAGPEATAKGRQRQLGLHDLVENVEVPFGEAFDLGDDRAQMRGRFVAPRPRVVEPGEDLDGRRAARPRDEERRQRIPQVFEQRGDLRVVGQRRKRDPRRAAKISAWSRIPMTRLARASTCRACGNG